MTFTEKLLFNKGILNKLEDKTQTVFATQKEIQMGNLTNN